ncbi:HEAT repeat domain-containing protein [Luteipulveratus halotolerans]|uniref:HEAT repeat-containing protein n=1 Tax=Luteipulveratus halotolerans TaxID=1631356 RepID=A0A0L6CFA5_9MICO|nr:HEAT repeat domain-containing protein [Luteipulveratus halotolerans]KNX36472.1 HEAT repeat-containing protein [Luteipulveratus halotolerans]
MTTDTLRLARALEHRDPSLRLRAAMTAGTRPEVTYADVLVARSAVEPDFFVREMLTWALVRLPAAATVPLLVAELSRDVAQARSQSLHSLSKIGDPTAWPAVRTLLHETDDDVARAAWRAAVVLAPEAEKHWLATQLAAELGRGGREVQLSLSRALIALGELVLPVLDAAGRSDDPVVRAHAEASERLFHDPEGGFELALDLATRAAIGPPPGEGG